MIILDDTGSAGVSVITLNSPTRTEKIGVKDYDNRESFEAIAIDVMIMPEDGTSGYSGAANYGKNPIKYPAGQDGRNITVDASAQTPEFGPVEVAINDFASGEVPVEMFVTQTEPTPPVTKGYLYVATGDAGGSNISVIAKIDADLITTSNPNWSETRVAYYQLDGNGYYFGAIAYDYNNDVIYASAKDSSSGNAKIYKIDASDMSLITTHELNYISRYSLAVPVSIKYLGTTDEILVGQYWLGSDSDILKLDSDLNYVNHYNGSARAAYQPIVFDGTHFYTTNSAGAVVKVDISSMSASATYAPSGGKTIVSLCSGRPGGGDTVGEYLICGTLNATPAEVHKVNTSTMAYDSKYTWTTQSQIRGLYYSADGYVYAGGTAGSGLRKIDPSDMSSSVLINHGFRFRGYFPNIAGMIDDDADILFHLNNVNDVNKVQNDGTYLGLTWFTDQQTNSILFYTP